MSQRTVVWPHQGWAWLLVGVTACLGCTRVPTVAGDKEYRAGLDQLFDGQPEAAVKTFDQVTALNANHAKAVFYRTVAREKLNAPPNELLDGYTAAIRLHETCFQPNGSVTVAGRAPLQSELANAYRKIGWLRYNAGDYRRAREAFCDAIGQDSQNPDCLYGRGLVFESQKLFEPAIMDYSEALRLDPTYVLAYCARARVEMAANMPSRYAVDDCLNAIKCDARCALAFQTLASVYDSLPKPDYAKVVANYEEARYLDPQLAAEIKPCLGKAYWNWAVELDDAARLDAKTQPAGAHSTATQLAQVQLSKAVAIDRAYDNQWRRRNEEFARAEVEHDKKPLVETGFHSPNPSFTLDQLGDRGAAKPAQREFDVAMEEFDKALAINPNNYRARFGRGCAFLANGFADTALEEFNLAMSLQAASDEIYCERSLAHTCLGDYFSAAHDATEAIRLQPQRPLAYYCRAIAYLKDGEFNMAVRDLKEATANDRSSPLLAARPSYLLEQVFHARADHEVTGDHCDEAVSGLLRARHLAPGWRDWLTPQLVDVYRSRAQVRVRHNEFESAIADLTAALDLAPQDAKCYRLRGLTHLKMQQWRLAADDLERAMRLDSNLRFELSTPFKEAKRKQADSAAGRLTSNGALRRESNRVSGSRSAAAR